MTTTPGAYRLESALARASQPWNPDASHIEIEQAFLDRTVLANTVQALRLAIQGYLERSQALEVEVNALKVDAANLSRHLQEVRMHALERAAWVEIEPGEYINPVMVQHVRDIGPGPEGEARCQVLMAMSGVTVHHSAADVMRMLGDLE
jgi:hypothetical protein